MSNKKNYKGDIPFAVVTRCVDYPKDQTEIKYREQQSYEHSWQKGFSMKPNCSFYANLEFLTMSRGRSAANFEGVLHDVDGDLYPDGFLEGCHVNIFMIDMLSMVRKCNISQGITDTYLWTFCKRGDSYGLRLVEDAS